MADESDDTKPAGDDKKPAITFPTEGAFFAAVDKKAKPLITKAVEEAKRAIFEQLGLDSDDELPGIVETVKKGRTAATEADTLKRELAKERKEKATALEAAGNLLNWKHTAIKQSALAPYSGKTVDLETLQALILPRLTIGDDDSLSGPNGKSVEDMINDVFKAKPFLKAPDNTPGAGTKPGAKPEGKASASKKDEAATANGAPKTLGGALVAAMKAQREGNP